MAGSEQGHGHRGGKESDHRALWDWIRGVDLNPRAVGGHGSI